MVGDVLLVRLDVEVLPGPRLLFLLVSCPSVLELFVFDVVELLLLASSASVVSCCCCWAN